MEWRVIAIFAIGLSAIATKQARFVYIFVPQRVRRDLCRNLLTETNLLESFSLNLLDENYWTFMLSAHCFTLSLRFQILDYVNHGARNRAIHCPPSTRGGFNSVLTASHVDFSFHIDPR